MWLQGPYSQSIHFSLTKELDVVAKMFCQLFLDKNLESLTSIIFKMISLMWKLGATFNCEIIDE